MPLRDVTKLTERLYIGSAPEYPTDDFDVIVLCAEEYQPPSRHFRGLVLRVPLNDSNATFPPETFDALREVAWDLADLWWQNSKILITCWMGRNRSALVSAVALSIILEMPTAQTAALIRKKRKDPLGHHALGNRYFWDLLQSPVFTKNGRKTKR